MEKIPGYTIKELIGETAQSRVYRAAADGGQTPCIIKLLKAETATPTDIARFRQEYALISRINLPGVIKTYDIIAMEESLAIVFEEIGGVSLKHILRAGVPVLAETLETARRVAVTLGMLHEKKVMHCDIKPSNIIIKRAESSSGNGLSSGNDRSLGNDSIIKIADFGIARLITQKAWDLYSAGVMEGTLAYLSPEQTGRINRQVDYRTDFYSLGITMYEMLTGRVPFISADPLEIIHSHIARIPRPPEEMNPGIPPVVSGIVMKLLSKSAEDRYQSGQALASDLQTCLEEYSRNGKIESFEIARYDAAPSYHAAQVVAGRTAEYQALLEACQRAADGSVEFVTVEGAPGIGKTALVQELQKPVSTARGFFLSGNFSQFGRDVPYSAIAQAFRGLVPQVLTRNVATVAQWRKDLLQELGGNGRVITEILPDLERFIGPQPPLPVLGPAENQNRFHYAFRRFIRFLLGKNSFILFLDDLQWADSASLELLTLLMTDPDIRGILLIAAYRGEDILPSHPLPSAIKAIASIAPAGSRVRLTEIRLGPLGADSIAEILGLQLRTGGEKLKRLSELVRSKTGGNPFFMQQFVKLLFDRELIRPADEGWTWDLAEINGLKVTDNVVELMAEKIGTLPKPARAVLEIASCMGSRFSPEILARLLDKTVEQILPDIMEAVNEDLLLITDDAFQFYHDRIQEAAYLRFSEEGRRLCHYRIGKLMLEMPGAAENIMTIADHLNQSADLITGRGEQLKLCGMNLNSGLKAKSSAAYRSAMNYLENAMALLDLEGNGWKEDYGLALAVHTEAAETAYLLADYETMEKQAAIIFDNAASLLDKIRVYEIRLHTMLAQNRYAEGLDLGRKILRMLGIGLPARPNSFHTAVGFIRCSLALTGKSARRLMGLTEMKDPVALAAMRIFNGLSTIAYYAYPDLFPLVVFESLMHSLRHGNCAFSAISYSGFGLILCTVGDIERGNEFGRMAMELARRMKAGELEGRLSLIFNLGIRHWMEPLSGTLPSMLASHLKALEAGDVEFGSLYQAYCYHAFCSGMSLDESLAEMEKYIKVPEQLKQNNPVASIRANMQAALLLAGREPYSGKLKGSAYDEDVMVPLHEKTGDNNMLFLADNFKMLLTCLMNDHETALACADRAAPLIDAVAGNYDTVIYYFYSALAATALCRKKKSPRGRLLRKAAAACRKLHKWAAFAPMNHLNKYLLVRAEIAGLDGRPLEAEECYEKSIAEARKNRFPQEEALACERAALFYSALGLAGNAHAHLARAIRCYTRWGARAKVELMDRESAGLPDSAAGAFAGTPPENDTPRSGTTSVRNLDVNTVLKASQSLSGEIRLPELLEKLLRLAMENAGAGNGCLVLENGGRLTIEAEGSVSGGITVLHSGRLEGLTALSRAAVNYVYQSGETLILDDAGQSRFFENDAAIRYNKVKSLLCAPIKEQGRTTGIIYLENNLVASAFSPERLELLKIISSQAAISIRNARLVMVEREKAAMDREMEMAEKIQRSLLPKELPDIPGFAIAYKYVPMMGIGGDFVNIHYSAAARRVGIFICDVSGHGVPAALTASMISLSLSIFWEKHPGSPADLLKEISVLMKGKMGDNFFTASACSLDLSDGTLTVSNAGHPPLAVIRRDGPVELLTVPGRLINDLFETDLVNRAIRLNRGDRLFLYTDGVTEAENEKGALFGADDARFCRAVGRASAGSDGPGAFCESLYAAIREYLGQKSLSDDITMISCEITGC